VHVFETIADSKCLSADVKSAQATGMQAQVLKRVHTEINRQVLTVVEVLRQIEDNFMQNLDAQQQAELSERWTRAREHRDAALVLDQRTISDCQATVKASESDDIHETTITEMANTLATLKTQHSEMQQIEQQQMAAATPGRDWAPLVQQLYKLRQQCVLRPRIVCSHSVSSLTGQGLYALRRALAGLMENTQLFWHVGAKVPLNYSMLERLAHEGRLGVPPVLYRGIVEHVKLDADSRTISFEDFCTVRSRQQCPADSKAYYELVLLAELGKYSCLQCGFACAAFTSQLGYSEEGVGDDAVSWAVDGARQIKWNAGEQEAYGCQWKQGDVIGLACDLQAMQMLVSVNGSFAPPNGRVFVLPPEVKLSGLFAAFSCGAGMVGYNLGEAPFKFDPPTADYCSFVKCALNQVRGSVLFSTRTCLSSCCMSELILCLLRIVSDRVSMYVIRECRRARTMLSSMDSLRLTAPTGSRP